MSSFGFRLYHAFWAVPCRFLHDVEFQTSFSDGPILTPLNDTFRDLVKHLASTRVLGKLEMEAIHECSHWLQIGVVIDPQGKDRASKMMRWFLASTRLLHDIPPYVPFLLLAVVQDNGVVLVDEVERLRRTVLDPGQSYSRFGNVTDLEHLSAFWPQVTRVVSSTDFERAKRALGLFELAFVEQNIDIKHILFFAALNCMLVHQKQSNERKFVETLKKTGVFALRDNDWDNKTMDMYRLRGALSHGQALPTNLGYSRNELCVWARDLVREALQKIYSSNEALERWGH